MKPIDLKCRPEVAAIIGEAYADYELQQAMDWAGIINENDTLLNSFRWGESPQGGEFWQHINCGENPYEHGHEKPELSEITPTNSDKERSDGSTASYYELPEGATELQHLISHRNLNAQLGEIFRACYRYGLVSHSDMLRDAKKIKFYAQAEIERLEKLAQSDN